MSYTGYSEIETEIVAQLAPLESAKFEVVQMPQTEAEFQKPFVNGRVTVAYNSSKADKPQSTGYISQYENAVFEVIVQCRKLRDASADVNGAHQIIEFIKRKLIGFQSSRSSKMWLLEITFGERRADDNLFSYSLLFGTQMLVVEESTDDTETLLTQITYNYDPTDDTNIVPDPNNTVTP